MDRDNTDTPFRFWPALAMVVLLLLALVGSSYYLTNFNSPLPSPGPQIGIGGGPDDSTPASPGSDLIVQINQDPDYFYGQSVILSGQVESTRTPQVFVISSD